MDSRENLWRIDLHTHTNHSDGVLSPEELIEKAISRKVLVIAVSDHDTVSGVDKAIEAASEKDIIVIPAIEFSAKTDNPEGSIHLLGYYKDREMPITREFSKKVEQAKLEKIQREIELANQIFGSEINYQELQNYTEGVPATVHLAKELVRKGYFKDLKEAMLTFVNDKRLKVKNFKKPKVEEAIKMIHHDGGYAVLAHPFSYRNVGKFETEKEIRELVEELAGKGLDGIETETPHTNDSDRELARELVEKHGLFETMGSDFHDENTLPENILGNTESREIVHETVLKNMLLKEIV